MISNYKVAHLIGLTRGREDDFRRAEKICTKLGYIVFAPVFYNMQQYLEFGNYPNMLDDMCSAKMTIADVLVLVTPDHVGESTRGRINEAAHTYHIPVYVIDDNDTLKLYGGDNDEK